MTDPSGPRPPGRFPQPPDPGGVVGPDPVPTPSSTPFGPGDTSAPDVRRILQSAAKTRERLRRAQLALTRMKDGPGPDGTDPETRPVTRADGQWPFLLIRSQQGDTGERPLGPGTIAAINLGAHDSPDIMFTPAAPATQPPVVDRVGYPALKARLTFVLEFGMTYDVWVHVWNLGQTRATGVRVRVYLDTPLMYLGGAYLDLGDRLSDSAHLIVKAATYTAGAAGEDSFPMIYAVAECITDPASGDRSPGMDRHSGHRRITVSIPT
jgi:hypothetical protein